MPSTAREDYVKALLRFYPGEEAPYNGGVVHSCRTCGTLVDQANLVVHDVWHENLHVEVGVLSQRAYAKRFSH